MELNLSSEEAAFRDEVRAFIAENYPAEMRVPNPETDLSKEQMLLWHRIRHQKGWIAPLWPKEHGGPGWSITQRFIFEQETSPAGTLPPLAFSVTMVGPVIYTFGNDAQKQKFLPRILSGEDSWCQGYSEPGSGSDLASVRTKAVRDGDHYIVNGHKTWTTLAQHADWIFCLVRTDPGAKPQSGISFLLIDMKSPGVTVRPIITIDGSHEINDVFLENVRVPVQNLTELTHRAIGNYGLAIREHPMSANHFMPGPDYGHTASEKYLNSRKLSIYGGSNEIQRNIIAKAVLGL